MKTYYSYNSLTAGIILSELEASTGDIPIAVHDSFKKDLDSYVSNSLKASVSTNVVEVNSIPRKMSSPSSISEQLTDNSAQRSLKASVSTSVVEVNSIPRKISSPSSISEQLTDNSAHRSLSKSKSDSLILRDTGLEDKEPPNPSRVRKDSRVKEHFYKFMSVAEQQGAAKVTDQQEQTTDMVCQKEQTKSSTNMAEQQETSTDTVNQKEQEGFTDINDQEEQTKSSPDTIDKQEEFPTDLVDQQEEGRSSTDSTDQIKPSARRQMDMSGQYMKHTLKRQYKTASTETGNSRRQYWGSDVTDLSHVPGTLKEFSKVCYN